ncbi:hypothetical protein FQZ97_1116960 [compost metagenome]
MQGLCGKTGAVVAQVQVDVLASALGAQPDAPRLRFLAECIEGIRQQVAEHLAQAGFAGLHPQGGVRQVADQFDLHAPAPFGQ